MCSPKPSSLICRPNLLCYKMAMVMFVLTLLPKFSYTAASIYTGSVIKRQLVCLRGAQLNVMLNAEGMMFLTHILVYATSVFQCSCDNDRKFTTWKCSLICNSNDEAASVSATVYINEPKIVFVLRGVFSSNMAAPIRGRRGHGYRCGQFLQETSLINHVCVNWRRGTCSISTCLWRYWFLDMPRLKKSPRERYHAPSALRNGLRT